MRPRQYQRMRCADETDRRSKSSSSSSSSIAREVLANRLTVSTACAVHQSRFIALHNTIAPKPYRSLTSLQISSVGILLKTDRTTTISVILFPSENSSTFVLVNPVSCANEFTRRSAAAQSLANEVRKVIRSEI